MIKTTLKFKKTGINGEGIAYYKKMPVFVEGCFADEVALCEIEEKGRYYKGKLIKLISSSEHRIIPECAHYKRCGACSLICLDYSSQLEVKRELLREALYKYAGYEKEIDEIVGSESIKAYRNKCNLPVVNYHGKLVNALYLPGSNIPCVIEKCIDHNDELERIRNNILELLNKHQLSSYDKNKRKGIRQLIVRGINKEYQSVIVTGNDSFDEDIIKELENIDGLKSIYQCINTEKNPLSLTNDDLRLLAGNKKISMNLDKYKMNLSPKAFFQLNYSQAMNIYKDVSRLLEDKCENVIEAYCGIGAISLYLSDKARHITGIDLERKAIEDARDNIKINSIDNVEFICDDASKAIRRILKNNKVDALVVDPPRSGLDEQLLKTLCLSDIKTIIYVSCNPSTLGKNLGVLKKNYRIDYVKGYDMFPNTALVETVVRLSQKHSGYSRNM